MVAYGEVSCPGCGLAMPADPEAEYDGYYNTTPECWSVYTEVLGAEFGNAVLFGQVHSLTVDAAAVQHTGGHHPDKSIGGHLVGLHLGLVRGIPSPTVPRYLQAVGAKIEVWPHFRPPRSTGPLTVFDVALSSSATEHADAVRRWSSTVWAAWSEHHAAVANLVNENLRLPPA